VSTERDEIVEIIDRKLSTNCAESLGDNWPYEVAAAILAAGFRKPDVTGIPEPAMTDDERAYYTVARDLQGHARLRAGRGLMIANPEHTLAEVQVWLNNAYRAIPGRIARLEEQPWHWVWQYRGLKELIEREHQEAKA
jgi:hypothetical protein